MPAQGIFLGIDVLPAEGAGGLAEEQLPDLWAAVRRNEDPPWEEAVGVLRPARGWQACAGEKMLSDPG